MAKPKKTAETHPVTTALVDSTISPIIAWCDAEYGRRAIFLETFRYIIAPETITRQVVESWLSTNPETRSEPMLGNGLALHATAVRLGIYKPQNNTTTASK